MPDTFLMNFITNIFLQLLFILLLGKRTHMFFYNLKNFFKKFFITLIIKIIFVILMMDWLRCLCILL